jgi:Flp pilus assembly protein TadG
MTPRSQSAARPHGLKGVVGALRRCRRASVALEFAIVYPLLLLVYAAGFEMSRACAVSSRLTDMTTELATVLAQYDIVYDSDIAILVDAAQQMMIPYDTPGLAVVMSEISTDADAKATVTWSQASASTVPLPVHSAFALPAPLARPEMSYIVVQTRYTYKSVLGLTYIPTVPLAAQAVFVPRNRATVDYQPQA